MGLMGLMGLRCSGGGERWTCTVAEGGLHLHRRRSPGAGGLLLLLQLLLLQL